MAIAIQSGLIAAIQAVRDYFTANGITAKVEAGWRRRPQQLNQGPGGANRVVFIPSVGEDCGELVSARFPGNRNVRSAPDQPAAGDVRSLQDWTRQVTVSVWAVDSVNLHDEEKQIEAAETLFEQVVRAVHSAPGAFAEAKWSRVQVTPPVERSFGLEFLAELTFKHPIFDKPRDLVYPDGVAVNRGSAPTPDQPPAIPGDAG